MIMGVAELGTTAVVVVLPEAQALLDAAARVDPSLVRPSLPAHATIRYPFVPITDDLVERLHRIGAQVPAVPVELSELLGDPGFLGVAVPELQRLQDLLCAAWPDPPPYGGRFGPSPPIHVTVGMGMSDTEIDRLRVAIRPLLPIRSSAAGMELVSLTSRGWRSHAMIPLGGDE